MRFTCNRERGRRPSPGAAQTERPHRGSPDLGLQLRICEMGPSEGGLTAVAGTTEGGAGRARAQAGTSSARKCVRILELRHHEKSVTRAGKNRCAPTAAAETAWTRAVLTDSEQTPSPQPLPFLNRAPGKLQAQTRLSRNCVDPPGARAPEQRRPQDAGSRVGCGACTACGFLHRMLRFIGNRTAGGAGPRDFSSQPPVHL